MCGTPIALAVVQGRWMHVNHCPAAATTRSRPNHVYAVELVRPHGQAVQHRGGGVADTGIRSQLGKAGWVSSL